MKTSDLFTTIRIVLAPIVLVLFFIPVWTGHFAALSMYILIPVLLFAEFTDFLDGYFARKHNEVSDFGKLYDPFADVLLHLTTFCCCVAAGYMPMILLVLILYREFCMLFLRMVAVKSGVAIAARKGGKAKTVLYVVSGMYALALEGIQRIMPAAAISPELSAVSMGLFILAFAASYISFIDYLVHFVPVLLNRDAAKKQ